MTVTRSASGLVTALEPLIRAYPGTWVAHGCGAADPIMADDRDGLDVSTGSPPYRLRYVWLAPNEQRGYYQGFANEALWPLCHDVGVLPLFRPSDFRMYQRVNMRFAATVSEEAVGGRVLVLVQDYHFALAPRLLRRHIPSSTVVTFWHIPWPGPEVLRTCPWAFDLLDGLLGSHVVGFQTHADCVNFLATAKAIVGADGSLDGGVRYRGHTTTVRAYPVGVEWGSAVVRGTPPPEACRDQVRRDFGIPADVRLGVGIDRLDYTKGINHKFLAIERFLERHPDYRGRFAFLQVAEPSRDALPAYRAARLQLVETVTRVNERFGRGPYRPIELLERHCEPADVYRIYRAADLCYVGSLRDGMNLVAKEFVCARGDLRGVLVLSRFAGAARQLRAALVIDPFDIDGSAERVAQALGMSDGEQSWRMQHLRANVEEFSASWWAHKLVHDATLNNQRATSAAEEPSARQRIPA